MVGFQLKTFSVIDKFAPNLSAYPGQYFSLQLKLRD